jgi:hypothetical protein
MRFVRNLTRCFALGACCLISTASSLSACPNCKEGLLENGPAGTGLARGFELSIYLMLGAPLLILSTLAIVFYIQIRSAKRNGTYPDLASIIAGAEAGSLPPSA